MCSGRAAAPHRTEDPDDQAVDVKQRQPMGDDVGVGPSPHLGERVEVGGDRAARQDRALGAARGPRRIDNEGRVLVAGVREVAAIAREVAVEVDLNAAAAREGLGDLASGRHRNRVGLGVGDDVLQFAGARLGVDRDHGDAGHQRSDDGHGRLDPGLGPHRHPPRPIKAGGDGPRRLAQLRVGQGPVGEVQRRAVGGGIGEGGKQHGVTVCPTGRGERTAAGLGSGGGRSSGLSTASSPLQPVSGNCA